MAKAFLEICDNNAIDAFWNITFFFRLLAIAQDDMSWIFEEEMVVIKIYIYINII